MATIQSNTIFTNVAETSDGGFYWEGLEKEVTGVKIRSWDGVDNWTPNSGKPSSHPNSRYESKCWNVDAQAQIFEVSAASSSIITYNISLVLFTFNTEFIRCLPFFHSTQLFNEILLFFLPQVLHACQSVPHDGCRLGESTRCSH